MSVKTIEKFKSIPTIEQAKHGDVQQHPGRIVGDTAHQGDIIFVSVAKLPKSAKTRSNRQIADDSTSGSRHIVEGGEVYDADASEVAQAIKVATGATVAEQYIGPVIVGPCKVTHPQHQHHEFCGTVEAVVYQRNQDSEERESRALD